MGQLRAALQAALPAGTYRTVVGAAVIGSIAVALAVGVARIRERRGLRYGALLIALGIGLVYARFTASGNANVDLVERVHFIEYWEVGQAQAQHFSWVTDLRVNRRNVYKLMRGGRARWKIENETFNTLKNQGYNFEHNYGHGEKNLSVVFAMLMMLAFLVDQTQQLCCNLFRAVWAKLGSKRQLWESMRSLFYTYALQSMRQLLEALFYGLQRPTPIFAINTS